MKKYLVRYSLITIFIVLIYLAIDLLNAAGTFKTISPHFNGEIDQINLPVAGPEDITTDPSTGLVFISSDDRRKNQANPGSIRGAILTLNISNSNRTIQNVTPKEVNDFHPHGISLFKTTDNRTLLFAISHRTSKPKHVVERFEWKNDSLIYLETIYDEQLMTAPNDLTATGERSFYITNDHYYSEPGIGRAIEEYLRRAISYVNYFDGEHFQKVADGIAYANGIQLSKDGSQVYVASVIGRKILIYNRAPDNSLSLKDEIYVNTGVDNIELNAEGELLIGCHPQLLRFVAHARDPAKFSPSQIIQVNPVNHVVKDIFLNDGFEYSGSTVASKFGPYLIIGSVFEPTILILKQE